MDHVRQFAQELGAVLVRPDVQRATESILQELVALRDRRGRLFCLGVGGGAANASHAVNDFRKLCGIEAYAATDGVAELTARANDDGWSTIFSAWLRGSHLSGGDAVLVFSVGGGHAGVSECIMDAVRLAKLAGARVLGVVGRADGAVGTRGDAVVVVSPLLAEMTPLITPITETVQVAVLHALVSDARLRIIDTTW